MGKMKLSILNDDDLKSIVIFRTPEGGEAPGTWLQLVATSSKGACKLCNNLQ